MQHFRLLPSPLYACCNVQLVSSLCVDTQVGRMLPYLFKVRPRLLLLITNAGRTRKCLFRVKGRSLSDGCIIIRGMYIISLWEVPPSIPPVMSVAEDATKGYLAPLQYTLEILRFPNNIIGAQIFMMILSGGKLRKFSELRNSGHVKCWIVFFSLFLTSFHVIDFFVK